MTAKIVVADRVVGVVVVESFEREDAFGPSEIRLLQTIVAGMGVALENARLFDETQRLLRDKEQHARELTESLDYQTAISDVLRVISQSPTDVAPVFEAILGCATRLFGSAVAAIYRYDGRVVEPRRDAQLAGRGAGAGALALSRAAGPGAAGRPRHPVGQRASRSTTRSPTRRTTTRSPPRLVAARDGRADAEGRRAGRRDPGRLARCRAERRCARSS